ncbi:MAG: type III pantothenate kinase [Candidatus Arcticimaribacter sp.]|nr:MAG: type III pantothenate kinase [Candidatus Arcticimaribacter sp.]PTL99206.1 MAG: type III pantothenate kinase [Candidatus Arcticimaribacter sp.]
MNLIIDAGNTAVKLAVFEEGQLILIQHVDAVYQDFKVIHEEYPQINSVLICDVRGLDWDFLNKIFESKNIFKTASTLRFPFTNTYKTPKTLGVDRMGLMAAAAKTYPKQNVLVIDVGTCITYDILTQENTYVGGLISPGYTMRYKSLKEFTGKLPLIAHESIERSFGVDTQSSIQAGVFNGVFYEIQGQIDHFKQKYHDLTIILTGGDSKQLSKRLKNTIFAHPNFLVTGLDYILELNKKQL